MKVEDPATELRLNSTSKYYHQAVPNSGRLTAESARQNKEADMPPGMTVLQSEVAGNRTRKDRVLHGMGLKPTYRRPTQPQEKEQQKGT